MPAAAPVAEVPSLATATEVDRTALRHALRDRALTRAEERDLAALAEHLDLGAAMALGLREEVEAEHGSTPG